MRWHTVVAWATGVHQVVSGSPPAWLHVIGQAGRGASQPSLLEQLT